MVNVNLVRCETRLYVADGKGMVQTTDNHDRYGGHNRRWHDI